MFLSVRLAFLCFENRRFHLKHNTENRPATNFTAYFDTSTMLPHDVLRNPQSQAGPFFAGGKERLEDAIEIVFGDTHAAIAELNHNRRLQGLLVTRSQNTDLSAADRKFIAEMYPKGASAAAGTLEIAAMAAEAPEPARPARAYSIADFRRAAAQLHKLRTR